MNFVGACACASGALRVGAPDGLPAMMSQAIPAANARATQVALRRMAVLLIRDIDEDLGDHRLTCLLSGHPGGYAGRIPGCAKTRGPARAAEPGGRSRWGSGGGSGRPRGAARNGIRA